jgi:hypothetical protein
LFCFGFGFGFLGVCTCATRTSHLPRAPPPANTRARAITCEIREASSPTMRDHFGCIFKATEDYTTGVSWAFYNQRQRCRELKNPTSCV